MIYIVGAGPGDVELISVKGARLLALADTLVYAGSLINPDLLNYCKETCNCINSANLTLEEVIEILLTANAKDQTVVRLHTGDPSLYGAIQEQMDALTDCGQEFEVVPGISSYAAAAASLKREFTLPNVSQSLVISRIAGRTPVPSAESPKNLAQLQASYAFFLSVAHLDRLCTELIEGGLKPSTPACAVYKASWPDEEKVVSTLKDLPQTVKEAGFTKTTMILIGDFLQSDYERSKLYDPSFSHMYRDADK